MYNIQNVARDVIYKSDFILSNLKLNKILYFVYAANLYEHDGERVIDESPEAWMYGPVFCSVYHEYKYYGANPIEAIKAYDEISEKTYTDATNAVIDALKDSSESRLISLTHREDGAWAKVYDPKKEHNTIPDEFIEEEFRTFYV